MGVAANEPHPLSDIAPRAPLSNILEVIPDYIIYILKLEWFEVCY